MPKVDNQSPQQRKKLKERNGERGKFTGTFVRYGKKPGWTGPVKTVLLKNICDAEGSFVSDHLWFNFTKGFEKLSNLQPDDRIGFNARVKKYRKGHVDRRSMPGLTIDKRTTDFKLSHPTKIKKMETCDNP